MTLPTHPLSPDHVAALAAGTDREIVTLGDRQGLRATRTYATDVADLWAAWTEPERLARWLGRPFGDLREGGTVRLVMDGPDSREPAADATTGFATVAIIQCAAPHRLTARWAWDDEAPSIVDLTLTPLGDDHTRLRLDHLVLDPSGATAYGAGWEDFLVRLEAAVTGADPGFASLEPGVLPLWAEAAAAPTPVELPAVTATGETSRLDVARWVAAAPPAVWACLTTREGLSRWYANAVEGDLEVGGRFRCTFDQGAATGEVMRCEPERELAVTWQWEGLDTGSRMTVTLTPARRDGVDGTHVAWREDGATGNVAAYGAGLHAHLLGLERAACGLGSTDSRWTADFVVALSGLTGRYANPFGG